MKTAVLVIDVQQALCSGKYAAFDAAGVIDRINGVTATARAAAVPVVFIQHESADGVLDHGSAGWQLAAGLNALASDIYLRKRATDSFHQTELQALLQQWGVQALVICGLQSEFCVDTTTRRAMGLGYPVQLVSDGHSTLDNGVLSAMQISQHHNITLSNIESFGPRTTLAAAKDLRLEG
jgi:nicotinamidase-related amidase